MTMLAKTTETRALTLADYEARIHLYKEQIGTGYIGIGRTLNEAKEAKVVPHGQWETWVTETTGLTPRQAQRCMQAATEIKDGSAMARLEMSKALMLLGSGLDEETREEIAEKAAEEGATVKDLREQLRKAKLQIVQETGAAAEIREALKSAEADREQLEDQMRAAEQGYKARLESAREDAYRRGEQAGKMDAAAEIRELQNNKKYLIEDIKKAGEREQQLREKLKKAEKVKPETVAPADYDQLKQNQADLLAAAEEAEKRAADAEAELEALRAGADYGRKPMGIQLGNAVGEFMRECSSMPFFAEELQKDRGAVISHLSNLESWIDEMYAAIGMPAVDGEGAVE